MSWLKKLFGKRNTEVYQQGELADQRENNENAIGQAKPEVTEEDPPQETDEQPHVTLETELPLQAFAKESEEAVRTISMNQIIYGKTIDASGDIIRHLDHRITGHSSTISDEAFRASSDRFKIVSSSFSSFRRNYAWPEEGAILRSAISVEGQPYISCTRVGLRPENPSKGGGREYTQAHSILIPADEWSVSLIPQLPDLLSLQPMREGEETNTLPDIETSTALLDRPLPNEWFNDEVRELVRNICTGRPIESQARTLQVSAMLESLYFVSLCLPEAVARRMSFATGMQDMNSNFRVEHGMRAMNTDARRLVGGQWKGDQSGLSEADRYIDALSGVLKGANSAREVMKAVDALPEDIKQIAFAIYE